MCSVVTLVVGLVAVCFLPQDGQFMSQLSMIQRVTVSSSAFFVLFYRYTRAARWRESDPPRPGTPAPRKRATSAADDGGQNAENSSQQTGRSAAKSQRTAAHSKTLSRVQGGSESGRGAEGADEEL